MGCSTTVQSKHMVRISVRVRRTSTVDAAIAVLPTVREASKIASRRLILMRLHIAVYKERLAIGPSFLFTTFDSQS